MGLFIFKIKLKFRFGNCFEKFNQSLKKYFLIEKMGENVLNCLWLLKVK